MSRQMSAAGGSAGGPWKYQLRLDLSDEAAEAARGGGGCRGLKALNATLRRHGAVLKCQYDAFAGYCAEAERRGIDGYPLYAWTRATIEDPARKAKYTRSFTIQVDGEDVYAREKAATLEADLQPLVGGPAVRRMARRDTNPANNPQPPKRYRSGV